MRVRGIGTDTELRGWHQTGRRTETGVGRVGAHLLHAHLNRRVHVIGGYTRGHYRGISERAVGETRVPLGSRA
jgi:hypothetical protein